MSGIENSNVGNRLYECVETNGHNPLEIWAARPSDAATNYAARLHHRSCAAEECSEETYAVTVTEPCGYVTHWSVHVHYLPQWSATKLRGPDRLDGQSAVPAPKLVTADEMAAATAEGRELRARLDERTRGMESIGKPCGCRDACSCP